MKTEQERLAYQVEITFNPSSNQEQDLAAQQQRIQEQLATMIRSTTFGQLQVQDVFVSASS